VDACDAQSFLTDEQVPDAQAVAIWVGKGVAIHSRNQPFSTDSLEPITDVL
jgi:hypothetical protein